MKKFVKIAMWEFEDLHVGIQLCIIVFSMIFGLLLFGFAGRFYFELMKYLFGGIIGYIYGIAIPIVLMGIFGYWKWWKAIKKERMR